MRFFKPQVFAGRLDNLKELSGGCLCGVGFQHTPVVGKEMSLRAGAYPRELCRKYAGLVLASWMRTAKKEWLTFRGMELVQEIKGTSAKIKPAPPTSRSPELAAGSRELLDLDLKSAQKVVEIKKRKKHFAELRWQGGSGRHQQLKAAAEHSKKARRELENREAIGGMRNPATAVRRLPALRSVGEKVADMFDSFVSAYPDALKVATEYGSGDAVGDPGMVEVWRDWLVKFFNTQIMQDEDFEEGLGTKFKSPLQANLLEAWAYRGADPEAYTGQWVRQGAPLGMSVEIPTCGIFPLVKEEDQMKITPWRSLEPEAWAALKNYPSMVEHEDAAAEEVDRLIKKGYACRISKGEAGTWQSGTMSKLSILLKEKPNGEVKKRLIIDLLRSGGNDKCVTPERIVLPRPDDVIRMVKDMKSLEPSLLQKYKELGMSTEDWGAELVTADLSDAYMHYAVHGAELKHCLTPDVMEDTYLCFVAMLFGLKAAPLVMGRLAAQLARFLQSMYSPSEVQMQIYMDDPLACLVGGKARSDRNLALMLLTMGALGLTLAWHKGHRADRLVWIGVTFRLDWEDGYVVVSVPEKMMKEIEAAIREWEVKKMVGLRQLRTIAGKCSWVAGILKKARWIVSIIYAVLTSCQRDVAGGAEEQRRLRRSDQRHKEHLVHTKRLELPRVWLEKLLEGVSLAPSRAVPLKPNGVEVCIVSDASPMGLGAVLAVKTEGDLSPLEAMELPVTQEMAEALRFEFGTSRSQGIVEALAVVMAVKTWESTLATLPVTLSVRSDSLVALAVADKLASSAPALNFLGAELALILERLKVMDVSTMHIPGVLNLMADWLSRPHMRAEKPETLEKVKMRAAKEFKFELPTPGEHPGLWGGQPCEAWLDLH